MFIAIAVAIFMLLGIAVILFVYIRVANRGTKHADYYYLLGNLVCLPGLLFFTVILGAALVSLASNPERSDALVIEMLTPVGYILAIFLMLCGIIFLVSKVADKFAKRMAGADKKERKDRT